MSMVGNIREPARKSARMMVQVIPVIFGILLILSLVSTAVPKEAYSSVFTGNVFIDSVIGAAIGSIAAGNPVTSYIIGGELLMQGISLAAITAFMVAWVTVGLIQFPAESMMLGKRFALKRNIVGFISSVVTAVLTVVTVGVIS